MGKFVKDGRVIKDLRTPEQKKADEATPISA